jgi:hypothetical protein
VNKPNDDFKLWTFLASATFACHRIVAFINGSPTSMGTGFIALLPTKNGVKLPFLVTNRHVVEGSSYLEIRINLRDDSNTYRIVPGRSETFTIRSNCGFHDCINENDDIDLALINITEIALRHGTEFLFQAIDSNQILDITDEKSVAPLRSICMIGCPKGIYDEHNNVAIARSGFLSSVFELDFNSKPWFAIDIASYPGSSGSPIFEIDFGFSPEPSGNTKAGIYQIRLLGILFGAPIVRESDRVEIVPIANSYSINSNKTINIAYCLKARELLKFALAL